MSKFINNLKRNIRLLWCDHEFSMWTYIGEKYTFHCPKCNQFLHSDNRDRQMTKTVRDISTEDIPAEQLRAFEKDLHNVQVKHNLFLTVL